MLSENISQTKRKTLCGVINRWNIKSDLEKQGREVAAGAGGRAAAQRRRWKRPEADCGDGAHGEGTNSCELHSLNG